MSTKSKWPSETSAKRYFRAGSDRPVLVFALLLSMALFYVFTYNSGYGYDALEYLVIGRSIARGQPFYSLIPSKSPGIYYLISTFLALRLPANHYTVSALITFLFAASLIGTWFAVRSFLGYQAALLSTFLVAACAAFMEMNYLEPESVVFLTGLCAFALVLRSVRIAKLWPLFTAGVVISIGLQFKAVAAFYAAGIIFFLLFEQIRRHHFGVGELLSKSAALGGGVFAGSVPPLLFFAATGRLSSFWIWTIAFPLFHYPANTVWLDKLYTKLLWFHLLLIVAFSFSILVVRVREIVWTTEAATLAFFMGLASYFALLKTQSSHYCFPGAAFFSIFIAATLVAALMKGKSALRVPGWIPFVASAVLSASLLSVVLYKPQVFARLVQWQNFQAEELLGSQVRQQISPGSKGLFLQNGSFIYWVSGVEPAWRFVYFDTQTTWFLNRSPDALLNALDDQSTTLVGFDSAVSGFEDQHFGDSENQLRVLAEFRHQLEKQFSPAGVSPAPFHFWVRKVG